MKLSSSLSVTAVLLLSSSSLETAFAGCPMGFSGKNPHTTDDASVPPMNKAAAANEHSMKVHKTPLVHFKLPPKDRDASTTFSEGGVLVDLAKADEKTREQHQEQQRKLDNMLYDPLTGYMQSSPAYSNQNVGDGYAIPEGGYAAVRQYVIDNILTNSKDFWPADFNSPTGPNYGGLFMRLAWHCNGTYRISDGRGGCDGGSIRFPPISLWPDNASLNMALELLIPVKEYFGPKLSWGDLIVLAADAAMEYMGGPVIGFCGGRIDWTNGDQALPLGPSVIQQSLFPCTGFKDGEECPVGEICPGCDAPLGTAAIGLIYVDPEGTPLGDVNQTAEHIREVFARMGFDDRQTVSAIGGGHAFGKCHGPCTKDAVIDKCADVPWGSHYGRDRELHHDIDQTYHDTCSQHCPAPDGNTTLTSWKQKMTSGLEVVWTSHPTSWDNEYFTALVDYEWVPYDGPGGHMQWEIKGGDGPDIQMLTSDVTLYMSNDSVYTALSMEYAASLDNLTRDFGQSWYQLMSRDMGPRTRCLGTELPPMQSWEEFDPPLSTDLPDYVPIRAAIQKSIDDEPSNVAAFATLAINCASTFRASDYRGGCNGAAIRFPPSIDWEENEGTSGFLKLLEPIKDEFSDISWSDLIVLAGQTSIESSGGIATPFCGGRSDADDGKKSVGLDFRIFNNNIYDSIMYNIANMGMSLSEGLALTATPDSINWLSMTGAGNTTISDSSGDTYTLSNQFFVNLMDSDDDVVTDWFKGEFIPIAEAFVDDNGYFLDQYAKAFNYLVTADLFDGPTKNACQGVNTPTLEGQSASPTDSPVDDDAESAASSIVTVSGTFFALLAAASPWMVMA
jgi:catalase (peroxidase I)